MLVHGKGSLEKLGRNKYRIRFSLGFDPVTDKYRRSKWRIINGTLSQARQALESYKHELEGGFCFDPHSVTFSEYAQFFLDERESIGFLQTATIDSDKILVKTLNRYIGQIRIIDIDVLTLKGMFIKLAKNESMSQTRLRDLILKTRQILETAVDGDILSKNPAKKVKLPKRSKPDRSSMSQADAIALYRVLDTYTLDRNIIAVYIGLTTGMRRGEVLALRWENIDFTSLVIHVTHAIDCYKQRKEPKSSAGVRSITIDSQTAEKLAEWNAAQLEMLIGNGFTQSETTSVCCNRSGNICDPARFYKWFKEFCVNNGFGEYIDPQGNTLPKQQFNEKGFPIDENGLPYSRSNRKPKTTKRYRGLKFHELRHTQATLLISNGMNIKTVQGRLGHSEAATTLNFYAHHLMEHDRKASDLIGSLLRGF